MTQREFELILLKSGTQKAGTRASYFRQKAKEHDVDQVVLLNGLRETYQRFNDYIQHPETVSLPNGTVMYEEIEVHEDGTMTPAKRSINLLSQYPGEDISGHLTEDHLTELLKGLIEFGASTSAPDHQAPGPKKKVYITPKSFPDYLDMEERKRQPFADKLKKEYPNIMGKELALLLQAMLSCKPPLIHIEGRGKAQLYNSLRAFFGWDIATNKSLNDGFSPGHGDTERIAVYKVKIQSLYKSIK